MSAPHDSLVTAMDRRERTEGLLADYTVAVKDNISTAGVRTTCGSAMLAEYVPPFDATVVERILAAGGRLVGKANMDEFGMGSTTETSAFGPTTNPHAPEHVPGGSSGGSAAAVAAGVADVALGSDTGGSIRNPAAFCGVVGLKPTYGLVSRYGLVAYGHSLEQIGPIGNSVADVARLLSVIAGPDDRDATCRHDPPDEYVGAIDRGVDGMTIGIPTALVEGSTPDVRAAFRDAIADLEAAGASTTELQLESLEHAVAAYYVIATSEASSNLARFDGVRYGHRVPDAGDWNESYARTRREGFGDEVTRRILLGTFALSAGYHDKYYQQAQDARRWIRTEFESAFEAVDLIASPTMPTLPFELGAMERDPLELYLADANTVPANLANLPAITVPADPVDGLPVGLQFVGPALGESSLLAAAAAVERR